MSSEVKVERFPYIQIITLSIVLGIVGTAWNAFQPQPQAYAITAHWGPSICAIYFGSAPFWLILIAYLLSRLGLFRKYVSARSLTYLYAVGATATYYISMQWPWFWYPGIIYLVRVADPDISMRLWQMWWAPEPGVCKTLISGGLAMTQIPWGQWFPVIIFYTVMNILYAVSLFATVNILRQLWLDVEKIPFPHTMAAYEFMKRMPSTSLVTSSPEKSKSKFSPFLIGAVLGVAFQLPVVLAILLPWFPDIFGWRTNTCLGGTQVVYAGDIASNPIYSVIVGLGSLNKNPATVAAAYFAPLNVLFGAWFFFVIYLILVQAWYLMGNYTSLMSIGSCCRSWGADTPSRAPPLNWNTMISSAIYTIAVTELIMHRHYIIQTVKKAFGKPSNLDESKEPGTYRLNWIIFIVSNVILIGLWMMNGLSFLIAAILIIQNLLHALAQALFMGRAATPHVWWEGNTIFRFIWPNPPEPWYNVSYEQFHAHSFGMVMTSLNEPTCTPIYSAAFSYRMQSFTGGPSNMDLFKTITLVAVIIIPIALVMQVIIWSTFGVSRTAFSQTWGTAEYFGYSEPYVHPSNTPPSEWWPWFVAGIVIVIALQYLHARFIWFPFEPLGWSLAFGYTALQRGLASTFIVAWVLKWLTLRIGGSKLYQEVGVPTAGGFLTGYMAVGFFAGLVGVYKFFFPF